MAKKDICFDIHPYHFPTDVFCPNAEYVAIGIPQVDGFEEISNIKCDHCSKPFETIK